MAHQQIGDSCGNATSVDNPKSPQVINQESSQHPPPTKHDTVINSAKPDNSNSQ